MEPASPGDLGEGNLLHPYRADLGAPGTRFLLELLRVLAVLLSAPFQCSLTVCRLLTIAPGPGPPRAREVNLLPRPARVALTAVAPGLVAVRVLAGSIEGLYRQKAPALRTSLPFSHDPFSSLRELKRILISGSSRRSKPDSPSTSGFPARISPGSAPDDLLVRSA